jgi:hypothetical protein
MINKDVYFGSQNFFYCSSDTTDATYDYVGYQSAKGAILIGRFTKTGIVDSALYYLTTGVYSTIWLGKSGYTYVLPADVAAISF